MFSKKSNILLASLFTIFVKVQSLIELRTDENIALASAETVIRDTFNNLFSTLKIRDVHNKPRLKEFATIHNYFTSITLKDCENLQEIKWLSRVNNVDNKTYFITEINEVLDGKGDSDKLPENAYLKVYVERFIERIQYLKDNYNLNRNHSNFDINPDFLQHIARGDKLVSNATLIENHILHNTQATDQNSRRFDKDDNGRRIYQGISVDIERFPFMASVLYNNKFLCAGCIISRYFIITSASCLQLFQHTDSFPGIPRSAYVRIGSTYTDRGGERISVRSMHYYDRFNPRTLENNIGLIMLNRAIGFRNVKAIDFMKDTTTVEADVIVLGWGLKDKYSDKSKKLSYAKLEPFPLHDCKKVYDKRYVKNNHFCAGSYYHRGGACNLDIGGPAIVGGKIYGIINFGPKKCGARHKPTVFTKVGHYSDWIIHTKAKRPEHIIPDFEYEFGIHIRTAPPVIKPNADSKVPQQLNKSNDFTHLLKGLKNFISTIFAGL